MSKLGFKTKTELVEVKDPLKQGLKQRYLKKKLCIKLC